MKNILFSIIVTLLLTSCTRSIRYRIEDYTREIDLDSNNVESNFKRGKLYKELKEYDLALNDFNKTIHIDSTDSKLYSNLCGYYNGVNDFKKAQNYGKKAIELDSTNSAGYLNLSNSYQILENYEKASFYLKKKVKLDSTNSTANAKLGYIYSKLNDFEEAIYYCNKAIKLDSLSADSYLYYGNALYNFQPSRYKESKEYFSKAIGLKPNYHEAYNNRGSCYFNLKDYKNAIKDFEKCIEIDKKSRNALFLLDYSYDNLEDQEITVEYYTKKLKKNSTDYNSYRGRARAFYKLKKHSEWAADINQCLKLDPNRRSSEMLRKKIQKMGFKPKY